MIAIVVETRAVLLCLAAATGLWGQADAREVVRRAVAANERNWQAARSYPAWERVDSRRLDSAGRLKSEEVRTYHVTLSDGSPYRRLAARDDLPLSPLEEKKERDMLGKKLAERRSQSPAQKAQRLLAYEQRPQWQREVWRELPDAFDFRITGEEARNGHRVYAITATPRAGYQPRSSMAAVFPNVRGTLWINIEDYQLVKVEVQVVDDFWMGLFLVRLSKGSRAVFEQVLVNGDVWLPLRVSAAFTARVGLLKMVYREHEVTYGRDFDFQSVSKVALPAVAR
jgi:hypothetical protein